MMTTIPMDGNGEPIFLDSNIVLRYHITDFPEHPDIDLAMSKLIKSKVSLWISRQVLREFATVLTRPQVFMAALSPSDVAARIRSLQPNYRVADETAAVTQNWLSLLDNYPIGGKQIHDANIVATMQAYRIRRLFTLNLADFRRFERIITLVTLDDLLAAADE